MDMIVSSCQNQTFHAKFYLESHGLRLLLVAIRINEKTDNTANRHLFLSRARGDKKALPCHCCSIVICGQGTSDPADTPGEGKKKQ
ncbi:hypothetical protein D5086_009964 [Populus alba]|uniref:Uncharacterized protein n=1 Tax=Populus alba TaxID=43335 RepID=A0ACC4C969_POPAL